MVIDTVQTFFNALKRWKIGIMAHCTYIVNNLDEPISKNFVKYFAKVSIPKLNIERAYMPLNRLFNTVGGVIEPKQ